MVCSTYMRLHIKNFDTKSLKKRYPLGYKVPQEPLFGDFSFTAGKSYNLEYIYMFNFKRSLKKHYSFKKGKIKKVWVFLHKNYPLTKKSKNARMGKGKGSFVRYCSRILQNHSMFEFKGFRFFDIVKIKKIFNKKVNLPIIICNTFFLKKDQRHYYSNQGCFSLRKYYQ